MNQNVNHMDHVLWLCRLENIESYVKELSALTGRSFHGPVDRADLGARVFISWEGGLEIIAPLDMDTPFTTQCRARLEQKGEGLWTVVFGVPDIGQARARAERLGYQTSDLIENPPDAPWQHQTRVMKESVVGEFMNTGFVFGEIEYEAGVFVTARHKPDGSKTSQNIDHLNHLIWLCRLENLERYAAQLGALTGHGLRGPFDRTDLGVRVMLSWEGGVQIVAPLDIDTPLTAQCRQDLESRGEGLWSVVFGVPDLAQARARAERLGYQISDIIERSEGAPWEHQTPVMRETLVGTFMNGGFIFGQVEYADGVFQTEKKSA